MAPRSQEPQDNLSKFVDYIGTFTFYFTPSDKATVTYVVKADTEENARDMAIDLFKKDFPFDGTNFKYTINMALVKSETQCGTSKYRIKKILSTYLDYKEKRFPDIKMKVNGELLNISQIKEKLKLKNVGVVKTQSQQIKHIPTASVVESIEKPKKIEPVNNISMAIDKKVESAWFCEYNVKLGNDKFRKGTKIEKVDNEIDARKQLDIYIKRNFSKIRSVTKVSIKKWNGEEDYSEEINEILPPAVEKVVEKKKTFDEIVTENFQEDLLNKPSIILAISPSSKVRPKDFERDFLIFEDEGQTDEELFLEIKEDFTEIKRKNVGFRRCTFKDILATEEYRKVIMGKKFQDAVNEGLSGMNAFAKALGMPDKIDLDFIKTKIKERKDTNKNETKDIYDSLRKIVGG